ncbi:MAG TPA: hypothetical protein VHL77_00280 [Ferruginibacter sp.]|jgi:hypothetical protein|nr:hypothetical protein [Ferruginibacter sp.]
MNEGDHIELRCINKKCLYGHSEKSIYVSLEMFRDNIHFCPLCQHPLVSEVDVAVFSLLIETGITTQDFR